MTITVQCDTDACTVVSQCHDEMKHQVENRVEHSRACVSSRLPTGENQEPSPPRRPTVQDQAQPYWDGPRVTQRKRNCKQKPTGGDLGPRPERGEGERKKETKRERGQRGERGKEETEEKEEEKKEEEERRGRTRLTRDW